MVLTKVLKDTSKNLMVVSLLFILLITTALHSESNVKLGLDAIDSTDYQKLLNKNVLVLTNFTGRNSDGKLTVELLNEHPNINVLGILAPEHGFFTTVPAGKKVKNDKFKNINIYSLYTSSRKPVFEELPECDLVIVDIQDIGVRSYTYISTVYNTLKAASKIGLEVWVFDRPNPLGGIIVDGNVIEEEFQSFVGIIPISYIHGCTIGELAKMLNNEGWLGKKKNGVALKCKLEIIKMKGWERWMNWEDTGLQWVPTSPHVPTVNAVRGLATLGIFGELGIISIGIGTTLPFQYIGSPTFNSYAIEKILGTNKLNDLVLNHIKFQPYYGMYSKKDCYGFYLSFNSSNLHTPYTNGIKLFTAINQLYPELFSSKNLKQNSIKMFKKVTGTEKILNALITGKTFEEMVEYLRAGVENYMKIRERYLLY